MSGFSGVLRALMAERGMSVGELARRSYCDKSHISRIKNGHARPSPETAANLDQILGAGGKLIEAARTMAAKPNAGNAAPDRRSVLASGLLAGSLLSIGLDAERLAWAERNPPRIDAAAVAALAGVLAAQRRAEDLLGSAAVLRPVTAQLAAVEDLVTEARGPIRPAVVDIAQQWTQFAAWLHTHVEDFPAARALWGHTLELAAEANDATMTATVLRLRASMAWRAGQPGPMIGLAAAAQRDRRAAESQRAFGASLEARGHAMTGDARATERKLKEAEELGGRLDDRPPEEPWSYWYSPGWLKSQRGIALGYLAHIDRYRAQALEALASAETGDSATELTAETLVRRAAIHARGGDVDEACADGLTAAAVAWRTKSASLTVILNRLCADLYARYPNDARVTELAEALR